MYLEWKQGMSGKAIDEYLNSFCFATILCYAYSNDCYKGGSCPWSAA